jgi:tetratricopeptide (TPR) repeat protein
MKSKIKSKGKTKYVMKADDYLYMGNYFRENEDEYDMAETYYKMGARLGSAECYFNLGLVYAEMGDFSKMEICYKKAGRRGFSDALNNLGIFYVDIGDYEEAIHYLKKGVKQDNVMSMHNLGKVYWEINEYDKMKKYYYMAGSKGCSESLRELGLYFHDFEDDHRKGQIYLSWAITAGLFGKAKINGSQADRFGYICNSDSSIVDSCSDVYSDTDVGVDLDDSSDCNCMYCQFH